MKHQFTILAIVLGSMAAMSVSAHEDTVTEKKEDIIVLAQAVTPEQEKEQAIEMDTTGPKETKGIKSVRLLGTVPLAGQFQSIEGYVLRARELEIEPGGIVAVHRHDSRPGVAYIISGQLTEHRAGEAGPVVKQAGDTAFEMTGTIHWWENEGDTVTKAIVVDLVPES